MPRVKILYTHDNGDYEFIDPITYHTYVYKDGGGILDTEKQHQYYVEQATTEKAQLINEATNQISYLQNAVDAENSDK